MASQDMRLSASEVRQVQAGKRSALILPSRARATYEVDRTYPVYVLRTIEVDEDEPDEAAARVRVTHVEVSELHEVDYRTMQNAGFKYREDLHDHWVKEYRQDPGPPDAPVSIPILVIRFRLDRAATRRYLRDGPRGGYAEFPDDATPRGIMADEPECVPQMWQDRISADLRRRDLEAARVRREAPNTTPLPQRLATAIGLAGRHGVDISRQLAIIGKRVEAIERIIRDEAA